MCFGSRMKGEASPNQLRLWLCKIKALVMRFLKTKPKISLTCLGMVSFAKVSLNKLVHTRILANHLLSFFISYLSFQYNSILYGLRLPSNCNPHVWPPFLSSSPTTHSTPTSWPCYWNNTPHKRYSKRHSSPSWGIHCAALFLLFCLHLVSAPEEVITDSSSDFTLRAYDTSISVSALKVIVIQCWLPVAARPQDQE